MSLAALMITLSASMLTSCSNEEFNEVVTPEVETPQPGTHVETLTIAFPDQTQTRVAMDGDHNLTGWELGDKVTLVRTFYDVMYGEFGPEGSSFTVDGTYTFTCTNAANGTFTGTMPNGYTVNDCQLAFYNATGFDTDGSCSLCFSPKTRASQNMKDVVMLVAKNDGEGNFEMEIFGSILQVTNNTGADITASVKYSWFGSGRYYDYNEIVYNDPDFGDFGTNAGADVNHPITLSKDAPTYVYIPVLNLNGGNAQYAVGLSAAGDAENECSIVPFKTNPGNAKLFKKTLTPATTGTAPVPESAGCLNNECGWVQLWENGPKWAVFNVGVTDGKPESYGGYFAPIGDTEVPQWGNKWRMPDEAELLALLNSEKCTATWVGDYNGVKGLLCTGKVGTIYAGNSVFFPAAGSTYDGNPQSDVNDICKYRGSYTRYLFFGEGNQFVNTATYMWAGYSVRAVLAD